MKRTQSTKVRAAGIVVVALACLPARAAVEASAPRQVTLQIYDTGPALVSELRSLLAPSGEADVVVRQLPARLDPTSVSVFPTAGGAAIDVLEQRFEYDLADAGRLLRRYLDRTISVGSGPGAREGRLVGLPVWREPPFVSEPLILAPNDGGLVAFNSPLEAGRIYFPAAAKQVYDKPALIWRTRVATEGQQNFRLAYMVDGLSWHAVYDVVLDPESAQARLNGRIGLRNETGGRFEEANVTLLETERGRLSGAVSDPADAPPHRYTYGFAQPREEWSVASLAPIQVHHLNGKVSIADGETLYLPLASVTQLPVRRMYVYDGVRFDRFQRNRRNDWNYGTEFHTTVDTHLEFENTSESGLGVNLPPGRMRLYQQRADDSLELLGFDTLAPVTSGNRGQVRVGPARGLRGERERTGYSEVRPLHEYEESFEIRLSNDSDRTVTIRVVEHLYRWPEFEIVKADTEYQATGPQTIEFEPELKPGGRKAIHYTVRYRW